MSEPYDARMPRRGRPKGSGLKLTPRVIKEFREGMALGLTRTGLAQQLGLAHTTVSAWHQKGLQLLDERRDGHELDRIDDLYASFAQAIEEGEGAAERVVTAKLFELVEAGNYAAISFWLERRRPQDYMRREKQLVESATASRIAEEILGEVIPALEEEIPDPEVRRRVYERIAARGARSSPAPGSA